MSYGFRSLARMGAIRALLIAGLAWSLYAHADETKIVVTEMSMQEQLIKLPALKLGGIRGGQVLLITDRSVEMVKFTLLAQHLTPRASPFVDFCSTH
jgi:hypothetical protein